MAETTLVNGQITDAVTQTNVKVVSEAPAQAIAMIYQTMAHSLGLAMQNAVQSQQQGNTINTAVTTMSVNSLMTDTGRANAAAAQKARQESAMVGDLLKIISELAADLKQRNQAGPPAPTPPTT